MNENDRAHVVIAGGGLAGLASAVWLAERGARVTLVEKRGRLGGRTISFDIGDADGRAGGVVDNGPHLFAGFYDALLRYVATIGTSDELLWDAPPFAIRTGPDTLLGFRGGPSWLPLRLQRAAGMLWMARLPIPWRDRPAALKALVSIARAAVRPPPELDDLTADQWLTRIGAPESLRVLQLDQLVIGLLNEKPDRVSAYMFVQTLHQGGARALRNARSMDAVWPRVSLHELFVAPAERYLRERGCEIVTGTGVVDVDIDGEMARGVRLADGSHIEADSVILALPPWALTSVLDNGPLGLIDHFGAVRKIEPAPISSVYVWLDRSLNNVRLAENLRDCTIEWVFDTSGMHGRDDEHCYALAVSASWDVIHLKKDAFIDQALASLRQHYPAFADAEVLRTHVIHQPQATFSAQPGFEQLRLDQRTPVEGLFLAGDWTKTELPSTMEAAAESADRAVTATLAYLS